MSSSKQHGSLLNGGDGQQFGGSQRPRRRTSQKAFESINPDADEFNKSACKNSRKRVLNDDGDKIEDESNKKVKARSTTKKIAVIDEEVIDKVARNEIIETRLESTTNKDSEVELMEETDPTAPTQDSVNSNSPIQLNEKNNSFSKDENNAENIVMSDNNDDNNENDDGFIRKRSKISRRNQVSTQKIRRSQLISKNKTFFQGEGIERYLGKNEAVLKELRRCKPNVHVLRVTITKENLLLIVTGDDKATNEIRHGVWPTNAFQEGVQVTNLTDIPYVAIKGVRKNLKLDDAEKQRLYNDYGILSCTRITGRDKRPTHTLKARLESEDDYLNAIEDGVYISDYLHQAIPWENRLLECTNCQELGHSARHCTNKYKCTRCSLNHQPMQCQANKDNYKCSLCGGNHASYEKNCPVKNAEKAKINKHWQLIEESKADRAALYDPIRIENIKSYAAVVSNHNKKRNFNADCCKCESNKTTAKNSSIA